MVRVIELERLLTRIMGFLGPIEGVTRVSIHTNLSWSNEVLIKKGYTPIFTLLHPPLSGKSMSSYFKPTLEQI